jgi:LacI family transcriptional regulator
VALLKDLREVATTPCFSEVFWNVEREKQAIQELLKRRVDGLIVLAGEISGNDLCKVQEQIPLIIVGRNIPALSESTLHIDDFQGAYDATKYLVELGHRQIVHVTGLMTHNDAVRRLNGYKQALLDAGIQPNEQLIIEGDYTEKSGLLAVQSLIMRGQTFSAIFCGNDQTAYGARLGLFRQSLRVPDDISLIGFDDQVGAAYMLPPLTTVRQPTMEIGEAAAQAILYLLKDKPFAIPEFPVELIIRESVGRYRY